MKPTLLVLALALSASVLEAQAVGGVRRTIASGRQLDTIAGGEVRATRARDMSRSSEPISEFLFAPEMVMRNQAGISLQESQRSKIVSEMSAAQTKFTEIQWQLSAEEEKLNMLLRETNPAETAVLAQMERVLSLEQNLKRTQMTMLVRIKSVLTPQQQTALRGMRTTGGAAADSAGVRRRGGE